MPPRHVQVPAPPGQPAAQPAPALRRRPRQSRAQASSDALQQAFVQLLLERGYAKATIREIAAVAGVSIGTFYEYFGDKQSLAALCIHRHVLALADRLRDAIARLHARRGPNWPPRSSTCRSRRSAPTRRCGARSSRWNGRCRRSPPTVGITTRMSRCGATRSRTRPIRHPPRGSTGLARMAHTICYGGLSQALLTLSLRSTSPLRDELRAVLLAYLAAAGQ